MVFQLLWGLCFGLFFLSGLAFLAGEQLYYEVSDSMAPVIERGSLLFVKEKSWYEKGDIVSFYTVLGGQPICVTHRIVDSLSGDCYVTKGDANLHEDSRRISRWQILGQVTGHIPYFGYACVFIQQNYTLLFLLPGLFYLWEKGVFARIRARWISGEKYVKKGWESEGEIH